MPIPSTFLKIGILYCYDDAESGCRILMVYLGESRENGYQFYVMHDTSYGIFDNKIYNLTEHQLIRLLNDKQFSEVDTDVTHR